MTIIDHSGIIRDMLFARLVTLPYFEGFIARRCIQLPIQPFHLPYLGVYVIGEDMVPDGDGNHGHIAFRHDLRLGISVQQADNDPVVLENKLNESFWQIMEGLWPCQYLMNMLDTYNPHTGERNPNNMRIESVERGTRRNNWGAPSLNNETPWAEMQYEPVLRYRSYYEPGPFDDLRWIDTRIVPLKDLPEMGPWEEKRFLTRQLQEFWIKHSHHLYEIERLEEEWVIRYRTVTPRPPHMRPENEVQRIIMRYEFKEDGSYKPPPLSEPPEQRPNDPPNQ